MNPILGIDCEHDRDDGMARDLLFALGTVYPGHSWHILIRGGIVKISNSDWMNDWGMCFPYAGVGDVKVFKQQALRMAGEFLERANQKRGAKTNDAVLSIEGVPRKDLQKAGIVAPDPIKVILE